MSKRQVLQLRHERTENYLGRRRGFPLLKEEVWRDSAGAVVKYSLAYIDPAVSPGDNGRVLGYDNAHGYHHRHYRGGESEYSFTSYAALVRRFKREAKKLFEGGAL
jgi:Family of unknown function (DUF6516)